MLSRYPHSLSPTRQLLQDFFFSLSLVWYTYYNNNYNIKKHVRRRPWWPHCNIQENINISNKSRRLDQWPVSILFFQTFIFYLVNPGITRENGERSLFGAARVVKNTVWNGDGADAVALRWKYFILVGQAQWELLVYFFLPFTLPLKCFAEKSLRSMESNLEIIGMSELRNMHNALIFFIRYVELEWSSYKCLIINYFHRV